ncbi:MAG: O-antigen ligase family protein [Alphaproteobacteria bacterium]
MTRLTFAGLLTLAALAPLPFASNRPWSWSLLSLLVGMLLVMWAAEALRERYVIAVSWRRIWPLVVMFAAVVGWIVLQMVSWTPATWHHPAWAAAAALGEPLAGSITIDRELTQTALMRLLAYAGVFWLGLQFGRVDKRARKVLWALAWIGVVYGVYGLIIEFGEFNAILWYDNWAYRDSVTSTFVNRNSYATYAGIGLLVVLGLLFDEVRRGATEGVLSLPGLRWLIERITGKLGLLLLMAAILGSALLLTGSRGGMIAFLVGLLVLCIGFTTFRGGRPLIAYGVIAAMAGLVVAMVALSGDVVLARFDQAGEAAVERTTVYGLVLGAIIDAPWLGVGYRTFELAFPLVRDASIHTPFLYDKAHNSYLEFAFEAGIPAFALMIGILGGLVSLCVVGIWKRQENRIYPCVGVAAAVLVATHALLDFSIQIPAVAVTFALIMGVATAQSLRHSHNHKPDL